MIRGTERLLPFLHFLRAPVIAAALIVLIVSSQSFSQEGYTITDVSFRGNETLSSGTLSELLLYPPIGWFGRTFSGDEPAFFSEDNMNKEVESLLRFYRKEGFLNASVQGFVSEQDDAAETVELTYDIEEGVPIFGRAMTIVLDPQDPFSEEVPDSLRSILGDVHQLGPGVRFRDVDLHSDRSRILKLLNNEGFPYATVSQELRLSPDADSIDIAWHVEPGPMTTFGPYTVEGTEKFNEDLIHDRVRFSEGDMYRQSLLETTQRDIYDLSLYRIVSIKTLLSETKDRTVPVSIRVQESSRYRFLAGIGYGRDEEFRISGRLDILGIFGTAGQVGLEVKRSALEPITVLVTYLHPDFLLPKARFTVQPFLRREDEPGYEARRSGYDVGIAKPIGQNVFVSLGYSYESVEMFRTPGVSLPTNYRSSYLKEAVNLGVGFVSASPLFMPVSGISVSLTSSFSGLNLFWKNEYRFTRTILDFRYYAALTGWIVMATRVKIGSMRSHDTPEFIPFEERFYSGGSISIRGWARSTLGPLDSAGRPIGGSSLLETELEFRFPHGTPLQGVLFVEAGNVWGTSGTYKLDDLGYSVGTGFRYATPIGPLRLDIAHPIFRGDQKVQWWFSIGHAF